MRKTAEFLMNFSHNHAIFHIWCTSVWAVCRNIVRHKLEENHLACFHVFVWSQNHHRHIFHGICSNKKSIYQMEGGRESSGRSWVSERKRKRERISAVVHICHTHALGTTCNAEIFAYYNSRNLFAYEYWRAHKTIIYLRVCVCLRVWLLLCFFFSL